MPRLAVIKKQLTILTLCLAFCISGMALAVETPDFTGVWMAYDSEPSAFGAPSYLSKAGQARVDGFYAKYKDMPEAGSFCVPPGMPNTMVSMVSYPIDIIHSKDRITILAELEMQSRRIFMDGRGHPKNHPVSRMGYSIAKWEADTLVIETSLLTESLLRGWPRTNNTRITERVYMAKISELDAKASGFIATLAPPIGDDALVFEITMVDETLYTQPRKITMYYQHMPDDAYLEYDCAVEHWMRAMEEAEIKE